MTDKPEYFPDGLFDKIILHRQPRKSYRDKILPLLDLPYKRTLFLDTDLELLSPVDDVFHILRSVDLVGCHAPVRWSDWRSDLVPEGVSELNSGVLGFRRCSSQRELVRHWLKLYDSVKIEFDQASHLGQQFGGLLSKRGLRTWILPPEYNLRTPKPWLTGSGMSVKIVHGRVPDEQQKLHHYLNDKIDHFRGSSVFSTGQNQKSFS